MSNSTHLTRTARKIRYTCNYNDNPEDDGRHYGLAAGYLITSVIYEIVSLNRDDESFLSEANPVIRRVETKRPDSWKEASDLISELI